jgi:AmiR/NasT family two-component response regulator
MRQTPNFTGWHAFVLHLSDSNTEKLTRQLRLLGFATTVSWEPLGEAARPDLVLVDADQGWDGLLPWISGGVAPCPVVALLGSEAPSRIAWALATGAGAILAKPVATSAIYPSLLMAISIHEERRGVRERETLFMERIRLRPLVHRTVLALMSERKLTEDDAYSLLRSNAMRRRETIEAVAASYLAGRDALPEVM